jgi:hypothetical protein
VLFAFLELLETVQLFFCEVFFVPAAIHQLKAMQSVFVHLLSGVFEIVVGRW